MTTDEQDRAERIINNAFDILADAPGQGTRMIGHGIKLNDGKLYELRVLAWLLPRLLDSRLAATIENGPDLVLRFKPGAVDRTRPFIALRDHHGDVIAEIWSNVEFVGIGCSRVQPPRSTAPLEPDYHELDIAVTLSGVADGRLSHGSVLVAVECKDRRLEKRMLREMLGLRRELSYMSPPEKGYAELPVKGYGAITTQHPPSRVFLCSSSTLPRNYSQIADVHGVHVVNVPI